MPQPSACKVGTFTYEYEGKPPFDDKLFLQLCRKVSLIGEFVGSHGGFPDIEGNSEQSAGNMSVRYHGRFIITTAGSHKARLRKEDFAVVYPIDEEKRIIRYQAVSEGHIPSSDVIFHGSVFHEFPVLLVGAILHPHQYTLSKTASLVFDYPPKESMTWIPDLKRIFLQGIMAVDRPEHDKNGASFFFGKGLEVLFDEYCKQMNIPEKEKKDFKMKVWPEKK